MPAPAQPTEPPPYPHAHEPWASYYLYLNPSWWKPRDPYAAWKLGGSRKATAIATWELREQARLEYEATYGHDPDGWPERHLTSVVWPTNAPTAVCIECLWLDGRHWEDRGARAAGRLHTTQAELARVHDQSGAPGRDQRLGGGTTSVKVVVLTAVDSDGRAALAVPLATAVDQLAAFEALQAAGSFGEARSHPASAALVAEWFDGYLERLREAGDQDSNGSDEEPFDADAFFGDDNWWAWHLDARQATAEFLDEQAGELAAELLEEDDEVRLNGPDNPPLVPPAARERLEQGLAALGFTVQRWDALSAFYDGIDVAPPLAADKSHSATGVREERQ